MPNGEFQGNTHYHSYVMLYAHKTIGIRSALPPLPHLAALCTRIEFHMTLINRKCRRGKEKPLVNVSECEYIVWSDPQPRLRVGISIPQTVFIFALNVNSSLLANKWMHTPQRCTPTTPHRHIECQSVCLNVHSGEVSVPFLTARAAFDRHMQDVKLTDPRNNT